MNLKDIKKLQLLEERLEILENTEVPILLTLKNLKYFRENIEFMPKRSVEIETLTKIIYALEFQKASISNYL